MKIKNLTVAALLLALMPAALLAQNNKNQGIKEAFPYSAEEVSKMVGYDVKPSEAEKLGYTKEELDSAYKAEQEKSGRVKKWGNSYDKIMKDHQRAQSEAYLKKKQERENYKKMKENLIAQIPADQKARYDAMAKKKDWDGLVAEVKYLSKRGNPKFNYDGDYYYMLKAAVKVDGKGLVSFGSLEVAQAIIMVVKHRGTANNWIYKEAKDVEDSVLNSGRAL